MGSLALIACIIFIIWLLRQDVALRGKMSPALLVPMIWFLMYSSRPVVLWIGAGANSDADGNPLDAFIQLTLIIIAFFILSSRAFDWGRLPFLNVAFFVLFFYFGLSIAWTPYPFIALKRYFKEFGNVMIVLVILTEVSPSLALRTLGVRCAMLWFPLSEVLIRWFPAYGRQYGNSGGGMVTGVTTQKNSLGQICAFYGLIIVWDMVENWRARKDGTAQPSMRSNLITLGIGMLLMLQSQSKTSLLAFLIGLGIFFCTCIPTIRARPAFFARSVFVVVAISLVVTWVSTVTMAPLIGMLGRDTTFSERTRIWEVVLRQDINQLVGSGFFSFWLDKGPSVWREFYAFQMRTAHSGYLEMYLDGGLVGLFLLGVFLTFTCWRRASTLSHENRLSRVLFAFVIMGIIINFSETCFFRLDLLWITLVLAALACDPLLFEKASGIAQIAPPVAFQNNFRKWPSVPQIPARGAVITRATTTRMPRI